MTVWALVPCSKRKSAHRCTARQMYWPSALFRGAIQVAERRGYLPLVLSARYGVLRTWMPIDPYDETLATMPPALAREWAHGVLDALLPLLQPGDQVISFVGQQYAQHVVPPLSAVCPVAEPLAGLRFGARLAWFKQTLSCSPGVGARAKTSLKPGRNVHET